MELVLKIWAGLCTKRNFTTYEGCHGWCVEKSVQSNAVRMIKDEQCKKEKDDDGCEC